MGVFGNIRRSWIKQAETANGSKAPHLVSEGEGLVPTRFRVWGKNTDVNFNQRGNEHSDSKMRHGAGVQYSVNYTRVKK